jgi:hypothetical protein
MAWLQLLVLVLVSMTVAGCELAGDIFEAGVWVGAILIVGIVAVIGFIAAKIRS